MRVIEDVEVIDFVGHAQDGVLVPIELEKQIPFEVKRMFYVFGVNSHQNRGQHAHYETQQILICLHGCVVCICKDAYGHEVKVTLDYPTKGVFIPEMIWDEQIYTSPDSVLLSVCSTEYNKDDYINSYSEFQNLAKV
jgi:dTDP-4-dehydrorhamnose 3,5-epimerase-like enzyme